MEARGEPENTSAQPDSAEQARLGRLGGTLIVIGSLTAVPAALFIEPSPGARDYLVPLAGALVGLAALRVPWDRLDERWLYALPIAATAYVMVGTGLFSDDFAFYQVLIGVYTAYVVKPRRDFLLLMGFFALATVAPLLYPQSDLMEQAHHILVTLPVFLISAAVVRYLRNVLEERERQYRGFAVEAVTLAERIRGGPSREQGDSPEEVNRRLEELASKTRT